MYFATKYIRSSIARKRTRTGGDNGIQLINLINRFFTNANFTIIHS